MEYRDACELLDADHIAVKHLFVGYARLAVAPDSPDAVNRLDIAMKICDELSVHAQIEEEIFYPALREALPADGDLLDEAEEEHAQAKALIAQIREAGAASAEVDDLVARLNRAIEHHVKEERDELFPKARTAPGMDLVALRDQLRQRQQELVSMTAA
ncbi:hemerythrin domain-containing protein [Ramlibacter sp.]|uniref:hemerythrin domain-containing protein n=1 Tax=Ramlibacter sp. TaxID=1917967 RepID=UPI002D7E5E22|nr:hemerythrin domain-containing protein [Ramlibacter sp.]